jgi:hypothetical protein
MKIRSTRIGRRGSVPIAALLAWLACGAATASAQFSISRFTIDGGGGTRSTGGVFAVGGTIGQPDAGSLSGSTFTLDGGFWFGGAAFTSVDGGTPGGTADPATSLAFRMYPATPNPITTSTVIAFDLPAPSAVRATLYDASGRLVRIMIDEPLLAGRHQRSWERQDGRGNPLASGIYFLRLDAGAHRSHQKLIVVSEKP